jgi:ferredoxin
MEIRVDTDLCEANAVCCGLAPDVFELDDNEQLLILQPEPPRDRLERVSLAVARCPKNALHLLARPGVEQNENTF